MYVDNLITTALHYLHCMVWIEFGNSIISQVKLGRTDTLCGSNSFGTESECSMMNLIRGKYGNGKLWFIAMHVIYNIIVSTDYI